MLIEGWEMCSVGYGGRTAFSSDVHLPLRSGNDQSCVIGSWWDICLWSGGNTAV